MSSDNWFWFLLILSGLERLSTVDVTLIHRWPDDRTQREARPEEGFHPKVLTFFEKGIDKLFPTSRGYVANINIAT